MNYQEALAYLDQLAGFGIKPGLQRITRLLELLDLPQEKYHIVHVTGTNGKGSASVMLASVLQHSSLKTGLFISPHLVDYTERIQIDGQPISEQDFADCLDVIKPYVEQLQQEGIECPTQFEVLTAMAFFHFAVQNVDYAVIEVGLGGLLDSTNVAVPSISVITNVTMEHAQWCGGTLEGVARHKAGIIKEAVPVVTAAKGEALDIIRSVAEKKASDIFVEGEDFQVEVISRDISGQKMEFSTELLGISHAPYELQLLGTYQRENSAVARMAAELLRNLDERITSESIQLGLKLARWPGRFELLNCDGRTVILDGAHNPGGIMALRESLDTYFPEGVRVFVLGILKDKDIDAMLESLLRQGDFVIATTPDSSRAAEATMLAEKARAVAACVDLREEPEQALARGLELSHGSVPLIVTGSLYLVGGIRQLLLEKR
ncbi:MAG: bifunctional folylpolyglutamate synthase/dihydrofolate synthase [Selenomonadaceae bacterium]|nr:bifunctional folylpolyglutamate synthase/dihydrofolate synthase [Selenomonadaceae bacterium]